MTVINAAPEPEKVALVDLDGTVADYEYAMRKRLVSLLSPEEDWMLERMAHGNLYNDSEDELWLQNRMDLIKQLPGFWRELPVISTGLDVYRLLGRLGYRRMVLSKGTRRTTSAWSEKLQWCNQHLPEADVTITHDKGLVYGKVLFDDWPAYIERWLKWRPRGKVLMLESNHNRGFEHPQVLRIPRYAIDNPEAALRVELSVRDFLKD